MHHVTRFDPAQLATPPRYRGRSDGYGRAPHIDRGIGAVHTGMGTCELAPGGHIDAHVQSYEEFVYVIEGNPVVTLGGQTVRLAPDEGVFIGVGDVHEWHNPGPGAARWIDLESPQARPADAPPDTFFVQSPGVGEPRALDTGDPTLRPFCRWAKSQMDLDQLKETVPVDAPVVSPSMSSALFAYSGITVKMLLDERHGAYLGNMFMVDYYPGVVLHPHDHTYEEAFYMLEGEVLLILDGEEHTLRPGDVAYAGVGCIHAFENHTDSRCRWLETRAPMPPYTHEYRFERAWAALAEREPPPTSP